MTKKSPIGKISHEPTEDRDTRKHIKERNAFVEKKKEATQKTPPGVERKT
jgi:hypothetical protein